MDRRDFLRTMCAGGAATFGFPTVRFAHVRQSGRLVFVLLRGGFDGRALSARQQRFAFGVDGFLRLLERLRALQDPGLRVGLAFHSLRAVPAPAMREVLAALPALGPEPLDPAFTEATSWLAQIRAGRTPS